MANQYLVQDEWLIQLPITDNPEYLSEDDYWGKFSEYQLHLQSLKKICRQEGLEQNQVVEEGVHYRIVPSMYAGKEPYAIPIPICPETNKPCVTGVCVVGGACSYQEVAKHLPPLTNNDQYPGKHHQPLFNLMQEEHGLTLLASEMNAIVDCVRSTLWQAASQEKGVGEDRGCPCKYLPEPCHYRCTCANPGSSLGCIYCATYGSIEQRKANAERIATWIKAGQKPAPDTVQGQEDNWKELGSYFDDISKADFKERVALRSEMESKFTLTKNS